MASDQWREFLEVIADELTYPELKYINRISFILFTSLIKKSIIHFIPFVQKSRIKIEQFKKEPKRLRYPRAVSRNGHWTSVETAGVNLKKGYKNTNLAILNLKIV
jgi:hypothetical protein